VVVPQVRDSLIPRERGAREVLSVFMMRDFLVGVIAPQCENKKTDLGIRSFVSERFLVRPPCGLRTSELSLDPPWRALPPVGGPGYWRAIVLMRRRTCRFAPSVQTFFQNRIRNEPRLRDSTRNTLQLKT